MTILGRQDSQGFGEGHREELRWVGKPWRRVELMRNRYFYKGEQADVTRDLLFHLGLRRLGFAVTVTFTRAACLDYSDEPNQ